MIYRLAVEDDFPRLAQMRWDFRTEERPAEGALPETEFNAAFIDFLRQAQASGMWAFWVAEEGGLIIAQAFIERIQKVPTPWLIQREIGYVTNVFTCPAYRSQGIGAQLMEHLQEWARQQNLEMLILWPSQRAVPFYERCGFTHPFRLMEYQLQEEYA
jgi:GNAT superfamily N-acetyltransferase